MGALQAATLHGGEVTAPQAAINRAYNRTSLHQPLAAVKEHRVSPMPSADVAALRAPLEGLGTKAGASAAGSRTAVTTEHRAPANSVELTSAAAATPPSKSKAANQPGGGDARGARQGGRAAAGSAGASAGLPSARAAASSHAAAGAGRDEASMGAAKEAAAAGAGGAEAGQSASVGRGEARRQRLERQVADALRAFAAGVPGAARWALAGVAGLNVEGGEQNQMEAPSWAPPLGSTLTMASSSWSLGAPKLCQCK